MRTNVTFRHPAEFVPVSEDDGILAATASGWFVELLQRIEGLEIGSPLIQEDWGVVVIAERDNCRFWIGVSLWPEGESAWLAHVHHRTFAWLQRLSSHGRKELLRFAIDLHAVLESDQAVRDVSWYRQADMARANPPGASTPTAA